MITSPFPFIYVRSVQSLFGVKKVFQTLFQALRIKLRLFRLFCIPKLFFERREFFRRNSDNGGQDTVGRRRDFFRAIEIPAIQAFRPFVKIPILGFCEQGYTLFVAPPLKRFQRFFRLGKDLLDKRSVIIRFSVFADGENPISGKRRNSHAPARAHTKR